VFNLNPTLILALTEPPRNEGSVI
jgi:hypothetical protein